MHGESSPAWSGRRGSPAAPAATPGRPRGAAISDSSRIIALTSSASARKLRSRSRLTSCGADPGVDVDDLGGDVLGLALGVDDGARTRRSAPSASSKCCGRDPQHAAGRLAAGPRRRCRSARSATKPPYLPEQPVDLVAHPARSSASSVTSTGRDDGPRLHGHRAGPVRRRGAAAVGRPARVRGRRTVERRERSAGAGRRGAVARGVALPRSRASRGRRPSRRRVQRRAADAGRRQSSRDAATTAHVRLVRRRHARVPVVVVHRSPSRRAV